METDPGTRLLHHLKQDGPTRLSELGAALNLSPTTVRHHLQVLTREGLVESTTQPGVRGRPAQRYALTVHAEGAFPSATENC